VNLPRCAARSLGSPCHIESRQRPQSSGHGRGGERTTLPTASIELGNATLDIVRRTLWLRSEEIPLTTVEFAALITLAGRFCRPVTRDELSLSLHGHEWNGRDRGVDVCIGRLRRKLRDRTGGYLQIRSVRGVGYFLVTSL
jgi:DNA-binding response OmpR family regulator